MYENETEADTRATRIDPVLREAGWSANQLKREEICPGRITTGGKCTNPRSADYVLRHQGQVLAVIEAKRRGLGHTEGASQAKDYAERMKARFAYSTNGDRWYEIDMETSKE